MSGDRHVLTGVNRLTARVAGALLERGSEVVVVAHHDDPGRDAVDDPELLPPEVRIVSDPHRADALRAAGLQGAASLVILGDDDAENLRLAAAAVEIDPLVPVILRMFNPEFADHLDDHWHIRRAYSLSALAAPAFVAAALGEGVLDALRLGDDQILLAVLDVGDGTAGLLAGATPDEVKHATDCAVVAVAGPDGEWRADPPDQALRPGCRVAVGGLMADVLALARDHRLEAPPPNPPRRFRRRTNVPTWQRALLPICLAAFAFLLLLTTVVYANEFDLGAIDAVHAALSTALGSPPPEDHGTGTGLFAIAITLAGLAVLSILFSIVAARLIEERLEERMGRQADRMHDHVIVAGLGRVGFRVVRLLRELGVPVVALERQEGSPFSEAMAAEGPVLTGDARLAENLQRAGVERARCLIACTDDDLTNLGACLEAKRLQPGLRTVARVFDDDLADAVGSALGLDVVASASEFASSAFVAAATDGRAARTIQLGDLTLTALRVESRAEISAAEVTAWRSQGLRILASRQPGKAAAPPTALIGRGLAPRDEMVIAGPTDLVESVLASLDPKDDTHNRS